jgi:hypothetical protein
VHHRFQLRLAAKGDLHLSGTHDAIAVLGLVASPEQHLVDEREQSLLTVGDEARRDVASKGQLTSFGLQVVDERISEATELSVQPVVVIGCHRGTEVTGDSEQVGMRGRELALDHD